jgi:hypothetical protein
VLNQATMLSSRQLHSEQQASGYVLVCSLGLMWQGLVMLATEN